MMARLFSRSYAVSPLPAARAGAGRSRLLLAVLAAAISLVASSCGLSLQSMPKLGGQSGPSYQIHADFANALNLSSNAQVRTGVATVGDVANITTDSSFTAHVTLSIQKNTKLPVGTKAHIQFDNPLGIEYVVVTPPDNPPQPGKYLKNGDTIPIGDTMTAPSVEDALGALSTVLNGGGINQLHTVTNTIRQTIAGSSPEIRDLLTQINTAIGSLAQHEGDIDNAIDAVANLSAVLRGGLPTITNALDTLPPAVNMLASENDQIDQLVTNVNTLARTADNIANNTSQQFITDVNQLVPVTNQLIQVSGAIGPALTDIAKFEQATPKIAPGDYLQMSLNVTANLGSSAAAITKNPQSRQILSILTQGLP